MLNLRQVLHHSPTELWVQKISRDSNDRRSARDRRKGERRGDSSSLESSEARLRFAAQAAGLVTYDLDCTTGESIWSPELRAIAGLAPIRVPLSTEEAESLIHPDDRQRFLHALQAALDPAGAGEFREDLRLVRPDGTIRWISLRGRTTYVGDDERRLPLAATGIAMDITDRVNAEEALRRSKQDLELAVRGANIGIWHRDLQTGALEWSEISRQLFGIPAGQPVSDKDFLSAVHPEDRQKMEYAIRQALETGVVCDTEYRIIWPDGSIRWIASMGRLIQDSRSGVSIGLRGISFDITERKHREDALVGEKVHLENVVEDRTKALDETHAALQHLRIFVEQAPSSIAMFDARMRYLAVSMGWCRTMGKDCRTLIGRNHYEVDPDIPERWKEAHQAALAGIPQEKEEDIWVRSDGSHRWVHWTIYPWRDERGAIGGIIISGEDITDRKQVEQRLRESEQRFRSTFEQLAVGVAHVSFDGRLLRANAKFAAIVGYAPDALAGMHFQEITHPDDVETDLDNVNRILAGTLPGYAMEKRYLRQDGTAVWVNLTVSLVRTPTGQPDYFVSVVEDIEARKSAESALVEEREARQRLLAQQVAEQTAELARANESLKRSNEELKQFAYIAAHDLKTPVRSIVGFAQLLQKSYEGRFDAQADAWLEQLVRSTTRMHTIIDNILAYSRIGTGRDHPVDFNQVMEEVQKLLASPLREAGTRLEICRLPTVMGDRGQLVQLLQHLIDNALKYRRTTEPPKIEVSVWRQGDEWLFSVADNGIGIEGRHLESIFAIFRRLHTHQKYPGTGIGLAICSRIVQRHGGRIWAESEPGKGSTFYFTLPIWTPR